MFNIPPLAQDSPVCGRRSGTETAESFRECELGHTSTASGHIKRINVKMVHLSLDVASEGGSIEPIMRQAEAIVPSRTQRRTTMHMGLEFGMLSGRA